MDIAELSIEGAGLALVVALVAGTWAALSDRRRILVGLVVGLTVALVALPFVAYVVARITNHQATDADLTPPAYIVVTSLVCAGVSALGLIIGFMAEQRRGLHVPYADPDRLPHPADDSDMIDDPSSWLPWRRQL